MMSEELKLCPFCGSYDVVVDEAYASGYARCCGCGAEGRMCDSYGEAVSAWSRRTVDVDELLETSDFFMPYPMGKDGELIKPGHTYYGEDGMAWAINAVGPVYCYGVDASKPGIAKRLRCRWLTKDAPDSWDSIRSDCALSPASYVAKRGLVGDYPAALMRIDLVARCNLLIRRCVK